MQERGTGRRRHQAHPVVIRSGTSSSAGDGARGARPGAARRSGEALALPLAMVLFGLDRVLERDEMTSTLYLKPNIPGWDDRLVVRVDVGPDLEGVYVPVL